MKYLISVRTTLSADLKAIVSAIQAAYGQGAAGFFQVYPADAGAGLERTVVFTRDAGDDAEYVRRRMAIDQITREVAARQQLAAELDELGERSRTIVELTKALLQVDSTAELTDIDAGALDTLGLPGLEGIEVASAAEALVD